MALYGGLSNAGLRQIMVTTWWKNDESAIMSGQCLQACLMLVV